VPPDPCRSTAACCRLGVWGAYPLTHLHLIPDNRANIPPLSFLQAGCPSCRPTNSIKALNYYYYYYYDHFTAVWILSSTIRVSRYQKGKTNLDFTEAKEVTGSGVSWAIYKSAPHPRQLHQHPTTQFFTGRIPFLLPNQQHQSTQTKCIR